MQLIKEGLLLSTLASAMVMAGNANAETVEITLSYPSTTYGYNVLNAQRNNMQTCTVYVDGEPKDSDPEKASLFLLPGTYGFKVICYGPDQDGYVQTYFGTPVVSHEIKAGIINKIHMPLKTVNPKEVKLTIDSAHISPGLTYKIIYLNGDKVDYTLDSQASLTNWFFDENPPIAIASSEGIEIGYLDYPKYTFSLMPKITTPVIDSPQATDISVTLDDGGYIYNPNIGLVINDRLENSSLTVNVPNVPDSLYEVRVEDSLGQKVEVTGTIVDETNQTQNITNGVVILQLVGDNTITIDFSGLDSDQQYKLFLIPQSNNEA